VGIKSGNYNATMSEVRPFKYWAQLAAIRAIMRDATDPGTVLDALFEPIQSPGLVTVSGVKSTGRPQGRPRKEGAT
jgi:hypothetical protein